MMLGRRAALAGGAALILSRSAAAGSPASLSFAVLRDGRHVGEHRIDFHQEGGKLTATIAVEIVVRLGPIALFRYNHSAREVWRDGQFESLRSETNDDGKRFQVAAILTATNLIVEVPSQPKAVMAPDTIPLTHWNVLCMARPLINPQNGTPIASRVVGRGDELVALSDGLTMRARRYSLVGEVTLDDWYDATSQWAALRTKAKDGSMVEYRRAA